MLKQKINKLNDNIVTETENANKHNETQILKLIYGNKRVLRKLDAQFKDMRMALENIVKPHVNRSNTSRLLDTSNQNNSQEQNSFCLDESYMSQPSRREIQNTRSSTPQHPANPIPLSPRKAENFITPARRGVELPKIDCPKFYRVPSEFGTFMDTFQQLIGGCTDITPANKISYLKHYLRGNAFSMVNGLKPYDASYKLALDVLDRNYNNRKKISHDVITEMLSMKAPKDNKDDHDKYFAEYQVMLGKLDYYNLTIHDFAATHFFSNLASTVQEKLRIVLTLIL